MLQANGEDGDFFKEFEIAKKEVFEWIRDEYRLRRTPSRLQRRDVDAVNGDTWYRNYQIKECQGSNKSSFCNGQQHAGREANRAPEISELFDELDGKPTQSDGGKLQAQTHHSNGADGKNIQHLLPVQHQPVGGDHYPSIEARLSAKQFLAKEQNAVHEIEMKHRHLPADNDGEASEKMLNGNQLPGTSLNSNFPLTSNLDTSKRSTGQQQKLAAAARTPAQPTRHFDDQLDQKRNDLFDEVDEKLSKKEQQGLVALHRVKRRDVNEINRLMTNGKNNFDEFVKPSEIGDGKSN